MDGGQKQKWRGGHLKLLLPTAAPCTPPQRSWPPLSALVWPPTLQATGNTFQPRWRSALALVGTLTGSSAHPEAGVEPSCWAERGQVRRGVNSCDLGLQLSPAQAPPRAPVPQRGGLDPAPCRPAQKGPRSHDPCLSWGWVRTTKASFHLDKIEVFPKEFYKIT